VVLTIEEFECVRHFYPQENKKKSKPYCLKEMFVTYNAFIEKGVLRLIPSTKREMKQCSLVLKAGGLLTYPVT
jgi:hypothetical protein